MGEVVLEISKQHIQHHGGSGRIKSFLSTYNGKRVRVIKHEGEETNENKSDKTASTGNNFHIFLNNICKSPVAVDFIGVGTSDSFKTNKFFVVENGLTLEEFLKTTLVPKSLKFIIIDICSALQLLVTRKFSLEKLNSSDIIMVERYNGQYGVKISALETIRFYGNSKDLPVKIPCAYKGGSSYCSLAHELEQKTRVLFINVLTALPLSKNAQSAVLQSHLIQSFSTKSWTLKNLKLHLYFWDCVRIHLFFSTMSEMMMQEKKKTMLKEFNNNHGVIILSEPEPAKWTSKIKDLEIKGVCIDCLLYGSSESDKQRIINEESTKASSLLRVIRNMWAHRVEINSKLPTNLKILMSLEAFVDYFGETFPNLLLELYRFVKSTTLTDEQKLALAIFLQAP